MGKNKPYVIKALEYLVEQRISINFVIGTSNEKTNNVLYDAATRLNLKYASYEEFLSSIDNRNVQFPKDVDLIISYLFPKRIHKQIINSPNIGCINFHPAPLPHFRGVAPYTFGILENFPYWGVSAHYVSEEFDTGDIIMMKKFDVNLETETSYSLEQKSQKYLFDLFQEIIKMILNKEKLPNIKQENGRYFSMKDFESLRKINSDDSIETIQRKIRAFWYPPHPGAYLEIKGEEFYLINKTIMDSLK